MQEPMSLSEDKTGTLVLRLVRFAAASAFIVDGSLLVEGVGKMMRVFDALGCDPWLRYLIGGLEMLSGVALCGSFLVVPATAMLALLMLAAFFAHLFSLGSFPAGPILLSVVLMVCSRARQELQLDEQEARWQQANWNR